MLRTDLINEIEGCLDTLPEKVKLGWEFAINLYLIQTLHFIKSANLIDKEFQKGLIDDESLKEIYKKLS